MLKIYKLNSNAYVLFLNEI